jgi:ssDNA-binding Zn-finger/Zn-ribbon topoisomerase 1
MNQEQVKESKVSSFSEKVIGQSFKEKYEFDCPECGAELWAKPSIFMTGFGVNRGGGRCPECRTYFSLQIDENNEKMIAKKVEKEGGKDE